MRIVFLAALMISLPSGTILGQAEAKPGNHFFPPLPDRLLPIELQPGVQDAYVRDWRVLLQVPPGPEEAVMICRPSFDPEECLVLRKSGAAKPTYRLIHTKADRNIWYYVSVHSAAGRRRVRVARREAELPREMAERVGRAWDRMLRGVRPLAEDKFDEGVDGETIEFRRGRMRGETWSPQENGPSRLVDLGRSMIDYCSGPESRRAEGLKEIQRRCEALERYLDEKPD